MTEPTIKGSITRVIDALENSFPYYEGSIPSEQYIKHMAALADLKAFKEALPDGLIDAMEYYEQMHEMELENTPYGAMLKAAKLTAEAVKDD